MKYRTVKTRHVLHVSSPRFVPSSSKNYNTQVCIPVGCLPPACCPYLPACTVQGGLSASRGSASRGFGGCASHGGVLLGSVIPGVCFGGVCFWGVLPRGVCFLGEVTVQGEGRGCLPRGCIPACTKADTPLHPL